MNPLPRVIADGPLSKATLDLLHGKVDLLPWDHLFSAVDESVEGIYTFGHPKLDGVLMDKVPRIKVISNYGVGVDHISLQDANARKIPVGNTPGVLDGATADLGFSLLLAAARRLSEGIRLATSPAFTEYNPAAILGRDVHDSHLGIIGLGRIGQQVARRAKGFDMTVSYYSRNRREEAEIVHGVTYKPLNQLLTECDFVIICVPLTQDTERLIGAEQLRLMKPTATLINIARGPVVDTDALTIAMQEKWIFAAALDVTDPEPLPRNHPLLQMDNVTVSPHLGSATVQTRQLMSELSVANLLAGLESRPLLHRVS